MDILINPVSSPGISSVWLSPSSLMVRLGLGCSFCADRFASSSSSIFGSRSNLLVPLPEGVYNAGLSLILDKIMLLRNGIMSVSNDSFFDFLRVDNTSMSLRHMLITSKGELMHRYNKICIPLFSMKCSAKVRGDGQSKSSFVSTKRTFNNFKISNLNVADVFEVKAGVRYLMFSDITSPPFMNSFSTTPSIIESSFIEVSSFTSVDFLNDCTILEVFWLTPSLISDSLRVKSISSGMLTISW